MIVLIPVGDVEEGILEAMARCLGQVFTERVLIGERMPLPPLGWDKRRGQYLASSLLANIPAADLGSRVLGVVDVDLYAPGLNFVFGQAEVMGKRALISLKRLRDESHGLPRDKSVFSERALKEAVHELGHTYGLGHCTDPACVMRFSNSLADTDQKRWIFCPACHEKAVRKSNYGSQFG